MTTSCQKLVYSFYHSKLKLWVVKLFRLFRYRGPKEQINFNEEGESCSVSTIYQVLRQTHTNTAPRAPFPVPPSPAVTHLSVLTSSPDCSSLSRQTFSKLLGRGAPSSYCSPTELLQSLSCQFSMGWTILLWPTLLWHDFLLKYCYFMANFIY